MEIAPLDAPDSLPLYCRHEGQRVPQPAYLEIDLNTHTYRWNRCGRLSCLDRASCVCEWPDGVVPLPCSPALTWGELKRLEDKLAQPLEAVFDNVEEGEFDYIEQHPLLAQIGQTLKSSLPALDVLDVDEWLEWSVRYEPSNAGTMTLSAWIGDEIAITASTSDAELLAIADRFDEEAMYQGVRLFGSRKFLRQLRRWCAT